MLRRKLMTLWQTHKKSKASLVCPTATPGTRRASCPSSCRETAPSERNQHSAGWTPVSQSDEQIDGDSAASAGIELLTGVPAGRRGEDGSFPDGTLHARVEKGLERWGRMAEAESSEPRD